MSDRLATSVGALRLPNPLICGSGEPVMTEAGIRAALAAGAAGVIAKSVNERPEGAAQLERADYAFLGPSLFCRSGLAPYDPAAWFATLAGLDREAAASGRFVAASLVLAGQEGAVRLAGLAHRAGLRVFELNVGAPHAGEAAAGAIAQENDPAALGALVAAVRRATPGMLLWVKLTGMSQNLPALTLAARSAGADAVAMMGRFMALVPDLDTLAPLLGTAGAYGGPWALPIVCRFLAQSRRATGAAFPLIGTNGTRCGEDVARLALAGASAIEVLSVVMAEGFGALTRILAELDVVLAARGLDFAGLIGRAADAQETYADRPVLNGRWRSFVPPQTLTP
ncbi:MAG: dihydroorotate dehydrogenase [Rhodospirillales bacterium]|nr:dihydroorotate dehydrogenase [Rhodospirillales bacterium]